MPDAQEHSLERRVKNLSDSVAHLDRVIIELAGRSGNNGKVASLIKARDDLRDRVKALEGFRAQIGDDILDRVRDLEKFRANLGDDAGRRLRDQEKFQAKALVVATLAAMVLGWLASIAVRVFTGAA